MSRIEWTEQTWNPVVGCSVVSPGCTNCYAMKMANRLAANPATPHYAGTVQPSKGGPVWTGKLALAPDDTLTAPLRRRTPTMYFVNSMGDLFHEDVPDDWIDRVFAVMALARKHTFQVLTKRAERMRAYLSHMERCFHANPEAFDMAWGQTGIDIAGDGASDFIMDRPWPLPNVWLGVSVEDQTRAEDRIPHLLATPGAVRFVSAEPLLGRVDLEPWLPWPDGGAELPTGNAFGCYDCDAGTCTQCPRDRAYYRTEEGPRGNDGCPQWVHCDRQTIDWVICGGESGPGARPMHPDWARSLRDQCRAAGVPFFFKQWGDWLPWEMRTAPMWQAQNGRWEDGNVLFPTDMDNDPRWDDGLNEYEPGVTDHCAFERIGKRAAGRKLDGRTWDQMPGRDG